MSCSSAPWTSSAPLFVGERLARQRLDRAHEARLVALFEPLLHAAESHVRQVLQPLEVRHGHAAGVRVDVGNDHQSLSAGRSASASGVVGPFAPSSTIFALMRGALSAVSTFSSAAGIRTSQSSSSAAAGRCEILSRRRSRGSTSSRAGARRRRRDRALSRSRSRLRTRRSRR